VTPHPVSPLELSAYRDSALDEFRQQMVESHIAFCSACRDRLAEYAWLGSSLRSTANVPVPAAVDERVAASFEAANRSRARTLIPRLWLPRQAWAAVAIAVLLVAALLIGLPGGDGSFGPTVASAYLFDDQGTPTIRVQFSGEVDRETVAESLRIEPSVRVDISWNGSEMVVRPSEPLHPSGQYTLSVNPASRQRAATPVALQFTGDRPGTPVPLQAKPAPSSTPLAAAVATETPAPTATATETPAATATPTATGTATVTPTATETAMPTATATPSPSSTPEATPTATATPRPAVSPTPVEPQPWDGFGSFLSAVPDVASKLGKAKGREEATDAMVQRFQRGLLVWREDTGATLLLLEGAEWRSLPSTGAPATVEPGDSLLAGSISRLLERNPAIRSSLGIATTPALPARSVAQSYQHGSLLWISPDTILVLYNRGSWEQHVDGVEQPEPTPQVTATAAALSTATVTAPATATPTAPVPADPTPIETPSPSVTESAHRMPDPSTPTPAATATQVEGENPVATATLTPVPTPVSETTTGGSS
jgi:hypothetical protein